MALRPFASLASFPFPAFTLALLLLGCEPPQQQPKLIPSDSTYDDHFGLSVALRGDDAIIGATGASSRGRTGTGAAYVFVRTSAGWSEQFKLFGTESDGYDDAGSAVAIEGDTALVGAPGAFTQGYNAGATYVFQRSGSTWTQQARLVAQDLKSGARFGNAVALAGDTALIAADRAESAAGMDSGAVYSFTRLGDKWQQQQKLAPGDGSYSPGFGAALALSGDTLLVGAREAERAGLSGVGAAYVFVRSNGTWMQQQKLVASDGGPYDSFGAAVALGGDTALIAAPRTPGAAGPDSGTVYVFTRSGSTWTQQQKLQATDQASGGFGNALALSRDRVLVSDGSRMAYLFSRSGSVWTQGTSLQADAERRNSASFAASVALSGSTALAGTPLHDLEDRQRVGVAYLFDL